MRNINKKPVEISNSINEIISGNRNTHDFISEVLIVNVKEQCSDVELWDSYKQWALKGGLEKTKRHLFISLIEDALRGKGARRAKSIQMDNDQFRRGFYGIKPMEPTSTKNVSPPHLPKVGKLMAVP